MLVLAYVSNHFSSIRSQKTINAVGKERNTPATSSQKEGIK